MKILIMGNNDHMGGIIVHYITLAKYIRKAGFQMQCINVNDTGARLFNEKVIQESVIPYMPVSIWQKIVKYLKLERAIASAKRFNPDIFIAVGYGHGYALMASRLPATTFKFFEEVHYEPYEVPLKLKMVKCFDAIAPQTKGMEAIFKQNISNEKPVAFLPCFSKEYDTMDFKEIPGIDSTVRLAYFGRLAGNKGVRQFIEATYSIFQNHDVTLDIYGKGSDAHAIKEAINKNGIHEKVKLHGFYEDATFPDIISSYHGIIIPSTDTEGLPLIVLEAMRYGRPILCTNAGAMPEIAMVNMNGIVVSEKTPQSLYEKSLFFIDALRKKAFSAQDIHDVFKNHFTNAAFWTKWAKMLENPRVFFNTTTSNGESTHASTAT